MPYEDDYKAWLENMLINMNPDWVCDGMTDKEFTHDWCEKYCGKDSDYITPKCLHMYYHHITRAEQTEPQTDCSGCRHYTDGMVSETICNDCKRSYTDNYEPQFADDINVGYKDEPQTDCPWK